MVKIQDFKWVNGVKLAPLTAITHTLELYIDFIQIVGARGTKEERTRKDSTFYTMTAAGGGGQVIGCIKTYYYAQLSATVTMEPEYLARQLPRFGD